MKPPEQAEPLAVLELTLAGHKGGVRSVAASPEDSRLVVGTCEQLIDVFRLTVGG